MIIIIIIIIIIIVDKLIRKLFDRFSASTLVTSGFGVKH